MSNRIDLTQFGGSYLPPWSVHRGRTGIWQVKGLRADQEHNRPVKVVDVYGTDEDSRQKNAEIIAAVPELIAELKRCYDLIDAQKENLEFLNGAIEKLHEETWTEAVGEFVEEHHPSEWCDYAVCWKCDEETASE